MSLKATEITVFVKTFGVSLAEESKLLVRNPADFRPGAKIPRFAFRAQRLAEAPGLLPSY
jgi:hypothetical protein